MAAGSVHFEIFIKSTPRADWNLVEVASDRDSALRLAHEKLAGHKMGRVKVTKEKFDEASGEFRRVIVHESGHTEDKSKSADKEDNRHPIPCLEVQDLYSMHSRRTISRVLGQWLARNKVTPFELLHRNDLAEKLDSSGMELQHAIQKFAIAEASATKIPVQSIIKELNKLSDNFVNRVYKDTKANIFPKVTADTFADTAAKLRKDAKGYYRFSAAVCIHLSKGGDWADKVDLLLNLSDAAPSDSEIRTFALQPLDAVLGEVVAGEAGLNELIGARKDLGTSLLSLADLFVGNAETKAVQDIADENEAARRRALEVTNRLGRHFAAGEFAAARGAVARRILKELKSPKRLCPNDVRAEIMLLRDLNKRLEQATGSLLLADDLQKTMIDRGKQLVAAESVDRYLANSEDAGEELERLFFMAENIAGAVNKKAISGYIRGLLGSTKAEKHFLNKAEPLAPRLKQLSHLQSMVKKCEFAEAEQDEIHKAFGVLGDRIEQQEGLISSITHNTRVGALERAIALLKLVANAHVPKGPATSRAVTAAKTLLRTDEARKTLASNEGLRKQFTALAACIDPAA